MFNDDKDYRVVILFLINKILFICLETFLAVPYLRVYSKAFTSFWPFMRNLNIKDFSTMSKNQCLPVSCLVKNSVGIFFAFLFSSYWNCWENVYAPGKSNMILQGKCVSCQYYRTLIRDVDESCVNNINNIHCSISSYLNHAVTWSSVLNFSSEWILFNKRHQLLLLLLMVSEHRWCMLLSIWSVSTVTVIFVVVLLEY